MNKTTVALGAGFAACAAALFLGSGPASAKALPYVDGLSWSAAQSILKADGFSAAVASTTGDKEKWADCEVTDLRESAQETQSMDNVTVSLNCDTKPTRKS